LHAARLSGPGVSRWPQYPQALTTRKMALLRHRQPLIRLETGCRPTSILNLSAASSLLRPRQPAKARP